MPVSAGTGRAAGYPLRSPEYRRVAIALFLAGVATFAMLHATQPLLPLLAADFGVSAGASAWSLSAATLALGVALLLAGPASEVLGRTPLMLGSLFAAAVVGIACGLAPSWPALLALRTLHGVALAGLPAVAMAYLTEELASSARARAVGLYVGGTGIGGMAGRLVTGGLAQEWGWRAGLIGIGLLGLACALAATLLLPRSRNFRPAPATWRHLAGQTRRIVTDPAMLCLFGIGAAVMGALAGEFNAAAFRLEAEPYSLSVGLAGLGFLVYAFGSWSSAFAGRMVHRFSERAVAPWAGLAGILGTLLTLASPLWLFVAGLAVMTMGFFALHSVASGWVAARATLSSGAPGQASSGYLFSYYLGASSCGALGASAWAQGGWPAVTGFGVGLFALATALTLVLRRIPSLDETEHPEPTPAAP